MVKDGQDTVVGHICQVSMGSRVGNSYEAYVGIRRVLEHAPHLAAILPQHMQEGVLSEKAPWYEDISKVWQCAGCKRSQKDDENPVDADITMVCKTWGRHQGWMNVYRPVGPHHTEV